MGLRKWLGIERLEKENEILRQYIKKQDETIVNIYAKTQKYKKENICVSKVALVKIEKMAEIALDEAAKKEIELAQID